MLKLPNSCRAGKMSVFPKNWKTTRAKLNLIWYIKYRFYDDNLNLTKQVVIKGMNDFSSLKEKQDAIRELLENELYEIQEKGYNPITKLYSVVLHNEIDEYTPLVRALDFAFNNIKVEPSTKTDIKSTLKFIKQAIVGIRYDRLSIGTIKKKHIAAIMEKTGEIKIAEYAKLKAAGKKLTYQPWSNNSYNAYRNKLAILFSYFKINEIIDANAVLALESRKRIKKIRETMTDHQFAIVNKELHDKQYYFWRFMVIFYDSTSRETEMMKVKKSDVDLSRQRFKITVKKGKGDWEEEWRHISNDVLYLWEEVCSTATNVQFLFSASLCPGNNSISPKQISRRWKRHVKDPLGITADFYSLKHSHITEMMDFLTSEKEATLQVAKMAGHTTTRMVSTVYDVNQEERSRNRVIKMPNRFT